MTPPLLLNENVPLPSANRLRGAGWDVLAIAESHASIDDTGVMRLAATHHAGSSLSFYASSSIPSTCDTDGSPLADQTRAECPINRILRQLPTTDFRDTLHVRPDPQFPGTSRRPGHSAAPRAVLSA
jgi:hypothetical protein